MTRQIIVAALAMSCLGTGAGLAQSTRSRDALRIVALDRDARALIVIDPVDGKTIGKAALPFEPDDFVGPAGDKLVVLNRAVKKETSISVVELSTMRVQSTLPVCVGVPGERLVAGGVLPRREWGGDGVLLSDDGKSLAILCPGEGNDNEHQGELITVDLVKGAVAARIPMQVRRSPWLSSRQMASRLMPVGHGMGAVFHETVKGGKVPSEISLFRIAGPELVTTVRSPLWFISSPDGAFFYVLKRPDSGMPDTVELDIISTRSGSKIKTVPFSSAEPPIPSPVTNQVVFLAQMRERDRPLMGHVLTMIRGDEIQTVPALYVSGQTEGANLAVRLSPAATHLVVASEQLVGIVDLAAKTFSRTASLGVPVDVGFTRDGTRALVLYTLFPRGGLPFALTYGLLLRELHLATLEENVYELTKMNLMPPRAANPLQQPTAVVTARGLYPQVRFTSDVAGGALPSPVVLANSSGNVVFFVNPSAGVSAYDIAAKKVIKEFFAPGSSARLTPAGNILAEGVTQGRPYFTLIDPQSFRALRSWRDTSEFSRDGTRILNLAKDKLIILDGATGGVVSEVRLQRTGPARFVMMGATDKY